MKKTISLALVLALGLAIKVAKADFNFGEPTMLGPTVNGSRAESAGCISADGLTLFITSNQPGGSGSDDLWVSTRATIDDPWSEAVNLGATVNSSRSDGWASISADGLTLYFSSYNRSGGRGLDDIWMTTRATTGDDWSTPMNLGEPVNSGSGEWSQSISADGLSLYFASNRSGGSGGWDIWVTSRATTEDNWSTPVNLGSIVNSLSYEVAPSISADGNTLFFMSGRSGGFGDSDFWMTKRKNADDEWTTPVNLGNAVNTSDAEECPNISADGRTLYFCANRTGSRDLWQISIEPVIDLNGDKIVDSADMCIMVDHWGEDYSLYDIGPMPWGDGVIDVQDLIVLSEYLFTDLRIFVDDDALDDPGPGDPLTSDPLEDGSPEHPFDSIQEAIDAAFEGGSVVVLPGTYSGDGNRDITFKGKQITVSSTYIDNPGAVAVTIIDCQGTEADKHLGFVFNKGESAQSVLAGLTITNGYNDNGGVIKCLGNSSPTISHCVFRNNTAVEGGVIKNYFGGPTFINCTFFDNAADKGGAIFNRSDMIVTNCTFHRNSAISGGAVYTENKSLNLTNCILWENTADEINVSSGTISVTYCDIKGGWEGEGNIDVDPLFADPVDGDYHLLAGSPCIDAGDPSSPVGSEPLPNGGRINMGAYGGTPQAGLSQ